MAIKSKFDFQNCHNIRDIFPIDCQWIDVEVFQKMWFRSLSCLFCSRNALYDFGYRLQRSCKWSCISFINLYCPDSFCLHFLKKAGMPSWIGKMSYREEKNKGWAWPGCFTTSKCVMIRSLRSIWKWERVLQVFWFSLSSSRL